MNDLTYGKFIKSFDLFQMIINDFGNVKRVIESCTTSRQNMVAYNMVMLYDKKYSKINNEHMKIYAQAVVKELHLILDDNLIKICDNKGQ